MSLSTFRINRRRLVQSIGTTAAILAAPALLRAQSPTVLKMSSWFPPNDGVVVNLIQVWAESISAITDGRVVVEFLEKPLGPPNALVRRMLSIAYTASRMRFFPVRALGNFQD